jgi:hypothetical protein
MDMRSQPRLETDEPVQVTVLGPCESTYCGRITNFSSDGIALLIDSPLAIGAAVKVEWSKTLLLGEVCHCNAAGQGFSIGLHLEHALYDTIQLAKLARRLLDELPEVDMEVDARRKR